PPRTPPPGPPPPKPGPEAHPPVDGQHLAMVASEPADRSPQARGGEAPDLDASRPKLPPESGRRLPDRSERGGESRRGAGRARRRRPGRTGPGQTGAPPRRHG